MNCLKNIIKNQEIQAKNIVYNIDFMPTYLKYKYIFFFISISGRIPDRIRIRGKKCRILIPAVYLNSYLCRLSAIFASSLCRRPARFATTKKEFTTARRRSSASTAASPRILAPRSSCTCALILVTSPSPAMCVNIEVVITIHYVDIS